jgi:hypothetical protein
MKIPEQGVFGGFSRRDHRLLMIGLSMGFIWQALIPWQGLRFSLALFGVLLTFVVILNQINRIKSGIDPKDPDA